MELSTQKVCDGVRIDKNIIPSYLNQLLQGTSNFTIEEAYYSGEGRRCQSGNCNRYINNVYVLKDNTTGTTYSVGSECVKKYGENLDYLVRYWQQGLERAKRAAMWQTKKVVWATERDERKKKSIETHTKELDFIQRYSEYKHSPFLDSIQNVIEQGWIMSEKQKTALDRIITGTDFAVLEQQSKVDQDRFQQVLEIFGELDKVKMGFYPGAEAYRSIRSKFAIDGAITDKQLIFLKGIRDRFRKQIEGVK